MLDLCFISIPGLGDILWLASAFNNSIMITTLLQVLKLRIALTAEMTYVLVTIAHNNPNSVFLNMST